MVEPQPYSGPRYRPPQYYGGAVALQGVGSVAAPLLAAAAVALMGVVIQQENAVRHPGTVLAVLGVASVVLVLSVQCGFWAGRHFALPEEIEQWHRHLPSEERREVIEDEHRDDRAAYRMWARRCAFLFNCGVTLIWIGLGIAVMPQPDDQQYVVRWVASVLVLCGALVEIAWSVAAVRFPYSRFLTGRS